MTGGLAALDAVTQVHAETRSSQRAMPSTQTPSSAASAPPRARLFIRLAPARAIVVGGAGLPSGAVCWLVHGYIGDMALAPRDPTRWPVHIGHLHDADAGRRDMAYWRSCSPAQRMAELDRLREKHDDPQPRLARVAVVIERNPR